MSENKTAVALGYFDGVHLGHVSVLKSVLFAAQEGFIPTVLLFDCHPLTVLLGKKICTLMTDTERDKMLSSMGLNTVVIPFESIKDLSAREFFEQILIEKLNCGFVACGFNYTFGSSAKGNPQVLAELCKEFNIGLSVAPQYTLEGRGVSSSVIRSLIQEGNIILANRMLGRNFGFESEVFSGDHRGRLLGSPTINQYLPDGLVVPEFGVYAAYVHINGKRKTGVANIGNRPTFDGVSVRSETFILDFDGDLYGQNIRTELLEFIRAEKKFDSVNELINEIQKNALYVKTKYGT